MTTYSGKDFWLRHQPRWPLAPLKAVARLGTGHTPSRSHPEYWEDCTVPWVTTEDLTSRTDGGLQPLMDTRQKVSELGIANSAAVLHPTNTVMLSRTASIGHSVRIGKPMATTQAFVTWTCGPLLDPRYLLLVMNALKPEFDRIAYGSTHLTIYFPDIEQLRVPVPPLAEQRAIADYLDTETTRIDALIATKRRMIEALDERFLLEAHALLTGSGASATWEPGPHWLGPVPRTWQPHKIAWRKRTGSGSTPESGNPRYYDDAEGTPWVTTSELRETTIVQARRYVTEAALQDYSALRVFPVETILVAMYGATVGRLGRLGIPAATNQACCAIYGGSHLSQRFLYWWLWSNRQHLVDMAYGSGQPNISQDLIRGLRVPAPSIPDQDDVVSQIEARASWMDRTVGRAQAQIELLVEHRQALITAAVTGELAVPGVAA